LGIEVAYSKEGIFLSQRKYIIDLLNEIGLLGGKAARTVVEPNLKLGENPNCQLVDKERYQMLVGHLIYLSHSRLDIAFAVSKSIYTQSN